jgi:Flp pilus assembly pilin Flp
MKTLIVGIIILVIIAYVGNKIVKTKMGDWS